MVDGLWITKTGSPLVPPDKKLRVISSLLWFTESGLFGQIALTFHWLKDYLPSEHIVKGMPLLYYLYISSFGYLYYSDFSFIQKVPKLY